jgi:hypothetical protein
MKKTKQIKTELADILTKKQARQAQATLLRKHLLIYEESQRKATEALKAINAIAMLENEGSVLDKALRGTWSVIEFSNEGYTNEPIKEENLDRLMFEAEQALKFSGYWSSR